MGSDFAVTIDTSSKALEIWRKALAHTRTLSPGSFDQWFSGVQFDGLDSHVLGLTARDEFVRDWVKAHFAPTLVDQVRELYDGSADSDFHIEWRISSTLSPIAEAKPEETEPPRSRRRSDDPPTSKERASSVPASDSARSTLADVLNPKQTFNAFVVGPSNELAYAAAVASAGGGGPRYNPLFLCGGTGLGKTHLMHAIAHRVLDERPSARVIYVSAERFTNDFIEALRDTKMEDFRAKYRKSCDLLLVDDIQFLAGRDQTQEEFFHTFNALRDLDKPIVVTSDKYPHELDRMPDRLVTRFASGLVADIQVPQLETRVAIVKKKAQMECIDLADEVAHLLGQKVQSNVRELEGTLIRLAAKSSLTGCRISVEFANAELAATAPRRAVVVSVDDIQRAVCTHFKLTQQELLSKDRHKSVAFARQVAMYLCRQRLKCSFPELGRAFGNRDHTTVMSAVRRVEERMQNDPQVTAHLKAIEERLAANSD